MEFYKVNYKVIEECLGQCESKEAIYNIFLAAATKLLDSEIKVLKSDEMPAVLKQIPQVLQITNEKAVVLILSLHALMKEYLACDEETLVNKFPVEFGKKIKTFLFKMMREVADTSKQYFQDQFTCLPKLRDFDWRLDVKISSKQSDRLKQPTLYVKMDLDGDNDD